VCVCVCVFVCVWVGGGEVVKLGDLSSRAAVSHQISSLIRKRDS